MKRDLDLQRQILLRVEDYDGKSSPGYADLTDLHEDQEFIGYNAVLLKDARLIEAVDASTLQKRYDLIITRLTHSGHEYLDLIRDDKIWAKTKDGAYAVGGFSIELLADLAKGFVKKQLSKHTGIDV